ncbi:ABC-F family ATP-binding cassette domain-containing protein [Pseudovibrio sp. Tun.PSC04-5.I4]|uniref:ABC-F family ATP-binding cassette domain-containing protein n=1 Tax=Pseudovibrio sp. Tun.PSC04-5.I4 TaxID=1798213 RepID=UPI00088A305A|nr:ABC-F family ATP-binding cassette domain-containing protein [Pseudovibrio sp. Tun.PSC04-5.I4]SDR47504.1 ATPase components of ABC transporters with duplicated ATPase domains [Pseudovibrio sp. Tun.PSC04-5.I4]
MPASISLTHLSWALPDGTALFKDLSLQFAAHRTGLIGRNGTGKSTLLNLISGALVPASGAVSVSGTVGMLSQQLQHAQNETIADLFGIADDLRILLRAEDGTATMDELNDADWTLESRLEAALAQMGLQYLTDHPLSPLSGGQITRCRLAALLFHDADFLLLDEPTNNLDAEGRKALHAFLAGWKKGALVISHDRDLLEQMDSIVELTTLGTNTYGGNWSFYKQQKEQQLTTAEQDLASAEKRISGLNRKIQSVTERKARKDGAGHRSRAKRDQPKVLLNAKRNRAESTSGDNANLASRLREDAEQQAKAARQKIEVLQPLSMIIASSGIANGQVVLRTDSLSAGYSGGEPLLRDFSLTLTGPERVAVKGPNGSGKTTLLKTLIGQLPPLSGSCQVHDSFRVLDQQASLLDPGKTVLENFRHLNPEQDENSCRAVLARFLFRGEASGQTVATLSGGMMLRAGLACVLGAAHPPKLLILDEPTNHLDIEAVEAIEAGLNAYDGALLVVSHDTTFLQDIGITRVVNLETCKMVDADG